MQAASEQGARRHSVYVANPLRDFVNARFCRLQKMDGALHPDALKIFERRSPQNRVKVAGQSPFAGSHGPCRLAQYKREFGAKLPATA